jgi:hypothetical protein
MRVITLQSSSDEVFTRELQEALNNPPANHFVQDVQCNTMLDKWSVLRWTAVIIYGDVPTT